MIESSVASSLAPHTIHLTVKRNVTRTRVCKVVTVFRRIFKGEISHACSRHAICRIVGGAAAAATATTDMRLMEHADALLKRHLHSHNHVHLSHGTRRKHC